jgi:DNA repair protein RecO (recombination protein O)
LQRVSTAEVLESFFEMQKDYRIQVAAQYLSEVTERFLPERELNERAFRLLLLVLRALKSSGEVNRPLLFFDYWLLKLGGFLPDLSRCSRCRRAFGAQAGFYDPGSGTLLCSDCRPSGGVEQVSAQALALIGEFGSARIEQWLQAQKAPPGSRELRLFLEQIIESHLERKLTTRPLLAEEV